MQVFRLVVGGKVDKLIAFDELPEDVMRGIKIKRAYGLPRDWVKWLEKIGSIVEYQYEIDDKQELPNGEFKIVPKKASERFPGFYLLEYKGVNADKEKWSEISSFVRRSVDPSFRLKDALEEMAIPMAADSYAPELVEYEDIPVIPIPKNKKILSPAGQEIELKTDGADLPVRKGRPKKVAVEA